MNLVEIIPANEKRNVRQKPPRDWLHEREVEAMIMAAGHNRHADRDKTAVERTKRSEKSAVIVERLVRVQLRAMGCERFDIGIKRDAGEMILREGQGAIEIAEAIKWFRHENAKGAHVYVRPAGNHCLSLIDDLTVEAIERLKAEGFEPAVIVETSPNNFQAWLNHGQVLDAATSTLAA